MFPPVIFANFASEPIKLSSVVEQLCQRVSNLQYIVTVVTQVCTLPSWASWARARLCVFFDACIYTSPESHQNI